MIPPKPKKRFGQHFLIDQNIARKICDALQQHGAYQTLVEVGPGRGVLTQYLLQREDVNLIPVELDHEIIPLLINEFPQLEGRIIHEDFLKVDLGRMNVPIGIIGNFPYNISGPVFFKILDNRQFIPEVVGMFQREVVDRIIAGPNSKTYGILSVLVQAFYKVEKLFNVGRKVFAPPPNVESAVIRLTRNKELNVPCNEQLLFRVVKTAFGQRRKTLRNSLKPLNIDLSGLSAETLMKRPEQLSVSEFITLTRNLEESD